MLPFIKSKGEKLNKKIVMIKNCWRLKSSSHIFKVLLACCLFWVLAGCIESENGLVSNCYNWPDQEFSPTNHAVLSVSFKPGDSAVDFTLKDTSGQSYTLSSLLTTKPVLLVFGSFT